MIKDKERILKIEVKQKKDALHTKEEIYELCRLLNKNYASQKTIK